MNEPAARHHYMAYGLRLSSNIPVPGLLSGRFQEEEADVQVELGAFPEVVEELLRSPETPWPHFTELPGFDRFDPLVSTFDEGRYFRLQYSWGVQFIFEATSRWVWGAWEPERSLDDAALYLTGPVLGLMLRLGGVTCLHASAVVFPEGAVALVGSSGAGKSTTASALGARGHPVLADDVVVLRRVSGGFMAFPAHGRLRVWPDAVEHLEGSADARPRLTRDWEKRFVDLLGPSHSVQESPELLRAVYLLEREELAGAPLPQVLAIRPTEALPLLAANTYRNELLSPDMRAEEFDFLADIVATVPVRRIRLHSDLAGLKGLCDTITADVSALGKVEPGVSEGSEGSPALSRAQGPGDPGQ